MVAERLTLAEFRKKHPSAKLGLASPMFPLIMLLGCAGFVALMLSALRPMARVFVDPHVSADAPRVQKLAPNASVEKSGAP